MKSYQEIRAEIARLETQAEEARHREIASAIAEIKGKMAELGITVADLEGSRSKKTAKRSGAEPKFKDPASGATWSGRGKQPKWLAGKNRNDYLIQRA